MKQCRAARWRHNLPVSNTVRIFLLVATVGCAYSQLISQSKQPTVTISEPATIKLADLFKQADVVALVKTVSGDTENYDVAVYKALVVHSFKGVAAGETIYFGPYIGERLGWEYFVFLRTTSRPLAPKQTSSTSYGTVAYREIFNEGYSAMMTSYECVFKGTRNTDSCDYAVRICTDYIKPAKSTPTFPPMSENTPFGCRWVRKPAFISALLALDKPTMLPVRGGVRKTRD